jgi:hypothetical protein
MSTELHESIIDEIREAIFAGKKIQAIKIYREAAGTGLKEAKEFIDTLAAKLYEESPDRFKSPPGSSGCAGVLLAIATVIGSAIWLVA